jgi:hypothetical protein
MIPQSIIAGELKGELQIDDFSMSISDEKAQIDIEDFAEDLIRRAIKSAEVKDGNYISLEIRIGVKR